MLILNINLGSVLWCQQLYYHLVYFKETIQWKKGRIVFFSKIRESGFGLKATLKDARTDIRNNNLIYINIHRLHFPFNMLFLFSSLKPELYPVLSFCSHHLCYKTALPYNTQQACFPQLGLHGRWDILKVFLVHIAVTCPNFALYQPDPVSLYWMAYSSSSLSYCD